MLPCFSSQNAGIVLTGASVMCPNRKLKWFANRGYDAAPIRARVIAASAALFSPTAKGPSEITNIGSNVRQIWDYSMSSIRLLINFAESYNFGQPGVRPGHNGTHQLNRRLISRLIQSRRILTMLLFPPTLLHNMVGAPVMAFSTCKVFACRSNGAKLPYCTR